MPPRSVDPLHCLTTTRVAVIAGKGGVGKTTVTAVLARAAANRGLRVLVIELDGKSTLAGLLDSAVSPELTESIGDHNPVDNGGSTRIEVLAVSPSVALSDYLDAHGLRLVSRRLASAGIIDVVATAAPGIDDIVVLGKIKQLERTNQYDLIVVDGPAAGHAVTFLLSATSLQATVRNGPIRTQADEVAAMLADPSRCQVILVTLPETTPVNELVETAYALEDRVGVHLGLVVVNAVDQGPQLDLSLVQPGSPAYRAGQFRNARRALHLAERTRLEDLLAIPQVALPQVYASQLDCGAIAELAQSLAAP